jgi:hypothetical protein
VREWTLGATIVGVVPSFDTFCLTRMLSRHQLTPEWDPDVIDVVPMAASIIRRQGRTPETDCARLSQQCGVRPPGAVHRHTALGDARWAMRWYDSLDARGVNQIAR